MSFSEHLFISDVHLGAFSESKEAEVQKRLIALIDYAISQKAKLYILGDLFDYWMEFPDHAFVPELGKEVLDKFEQYNKKVTPALFITGNHDCWTYGHFNERGFDVESDYRICDVDDSRALLIHGDGLPQPSGEIYRPPFHRFLRNRTFISIYQKLLPPGPGLWLMKTFSSVTRKRNYTNPVPLNNFAKKALTDHKTNIVLSGHDHIPRSETFEHGTYINLGTFFNHNTLVRYINNAFSLVTWHEDTKEFVPYGHNASTL